MPRIFKHLEAGCLQVNFMSTSAQINQLKYTILYHTTPHHIIPYHTTPHHTIPYHTTPNHITPHHTISHPTTPHHTIPYYTIQFQALPLIPRVIIYTRAIDVATYQMPFGSA